MAIEFHFPSHIKPKSVILRMMLGAGIALVIISFLVFNVNTPPPEWGQYWKIRPLIFTPIVGAFGILSFYLKDFIRPQSDVKSVILFIISLILFLISLWMGVIIGLVGTMWN
jgi:hypothetical protein